MIRSIMLLAAVLSVFVLLGAAGAGEQNKSGPIKSVDAQARSFVLELPARPLTFSTNDKTAFTLDGKKSTFEAAIKAGRRASVRYERKDADTRVAVKVEATGSAEK